MKTKLGTRSYLHATKIITQKIFEKKLGKERKKNMKNSCVIKEKKS